MLKIRKYCPQADAEKLLAMIAAEGAGWKDYWEKEVADKYKKTLADSVTYVASEGEELCAYLRAFNDHDYYIYVCDLLVTARYRGKDIGRQLLEHIYHDYPNIMGVLVMSDVDGYYQKLAYENIGSIFAVARGRKRK